jgi:hypothetical protein
MYTAKFVISVAICWLVAAFSYVITCTDKGGPTKEALLHKWQTQCTSLAIGLHQRDRLDSLGAEPTGARPPVPRVTCVLLPGPSPSKSGQRMVTRSTVAKFSQLSILPFFVRLASFYCWRCVDDTDDCVVGVPV